jgi:hypothetical protein
MSVPIGTILACPLSPLLVSRLVFKSIEDISYLWIRGAPRPELDADGDNIQAKVADDIPQMLKVWSINSCTFRKAKPLTGGAVGMMYIFDRSFDAPGGGSCPFLDVGQLHSSNNLWT